VGELPVTDEQQFVELLGGSVNAILREAEDKFDFLPWWDEGWRNHLRVAMIESMWAVFRSSMLGVIAGVEHGDRLIDTQRPDE
jgi:hypothetical protein